MANQNFNTFNRAGTTDLAFDAGLRAHMIRVYNYMASGLALSASWPSRCSARRRSPATFQVAPGASSASTCWAGSAIWRSVCCFVGFRAQQMSVTGVQVTYWSVTA